MQESKSKVNGESAEQVSIEINPHKRNGLVLELRRSEDIVITAPDGKSITMSIAKKTKNGKGGESLGVWVLFSGDREMNIKRVKKGGE